MGLEDDRKADEFWPSLKEGTFARTSERDPDYNCVAWAVHDSKKWWEPSGRDEDYWPRKAPLGYDLESYLAAFRSRSYEVCEDGNLDARFEKIAIYWRNGDKPDDGFKHVARQLPDGQWTSKLGDARDITHQSLADLEGEFYGYVDVYMRRPRAQAQRPKRTRARKRQTRS